MPAEEDEEEITYNNRRQCKRQVYQNLKQQLPPEDTIGEDV